MIQLSKAMQAAIEKTQDNMELRMEDIIPIMQLAREEFQIDKIIICSNREYKYQVSHVLTCSAEGIQLRKPVTYSMTRAEYDAQLQLYREKPIVNAPIRKLEQEMGGYFLNSGILREGEYFGTVMFWNKENRIWSEEEKYVLLKLRYLCLLFFGMNHLVHGVNRYQQAFEEFQKDRVVSGFFVNMVTGEIQAIKLPEGMKSVFPEWGEYDVLLNVYAQNYVEGFYKKQLLDKGGFAAIKKKLTKTDPVLFTEFPRFYHGELNWIRFQVRAYDFQEDGTPSMAMAAFVDITDDVKNNAYLFCANNASLKNYTTIIALNLNTEQYAVCVNEQRKESVAVSFDLCGQYSQISEVILPRISREEREGVLKHFFDVNYLMRHFDESDSLLQCVFSFAGKQQLYWIRLVIIKAADYSLENRKVMLYYSDITEAKSRQLLLEKENQEKKYQLEHDSLTGAYNRHGYEEILNRYKSDLRPTAYIQLDIDCFKQLNDTYGHEFGDEVLKQVVTLLKNTFRADDYVFRFGGDEFAVLLTNCKVVLWENISEKQRLLHIRLNQILKKGIYVTFSMGISWSEAGFKTELVALADAALYQVKNKGRAGCCVLDSEHHTIYEWKDDIGNNAEENVLDQSETGACRIELPDGDLDQGRLICNETARILMGFDPGMSPEECFKTWLERVDPYSRESITKTRKAMLEMGQAECTYLYSHPLQGQIMVRSGGRCLTNEDGIVFYGYHQCLQDTRIVLRVDDSQKLIEAMTSLYFLSCYISLQDDWFWIFKTAEESRHLEKQDISASVNIQHFVQTLVKPEHREKMSRFVDLKTLPERLQDRDFVETEYESMVADKGWCRVRFLAVRRDKSGTVTHVQMLIASIDKEKKNQLEQEKAVQNALELQLRIGEMVAETKIQSVGLIDRKTGETKVYLNGVISKDAVMVSFERMHQWGLAKAYSLDAGLFDKQFKLPYIEAQIKKDGNCTMAFRQMGEHNEIQTLIHHYKIYQNDPSKILLVVENITNASAKGMGRIEEFGILDQLTESVAVFDYETYEVVFVNKTVRDAMGMSMSEMQGRKCHELFCGRKEPCEFCDKIILEQGQHGFMCRTVEATGESSFLHGCVIEVNGRRYRLEQAISLQHLCNLESKLQTIFEKIKRD